VQPPTLVCDYCLVSQNPFKVTRTGKAYQLQKVVPSLQLCFHKASFRQRQDIAYQSLNVRLFDFAEDCSENANGAGPSITSFDADYGHQCLRYRFVIASERPSAQDGKHMRDHERPGIWVSASVLYQEVCYSHTCDVFPYLGFWSFPVKQS